MLREIDGLIGVKQSAGDLKLLADLLLRFGRCGLDYVGGGRAAVSVFCLGRAWRDCGDIDCRAGIVRAAVGMRRRQATMRWRWRCISGLLPIWDAIMADNLPANVKTALELQGRPAGIPRMPMPPSSPQQRAAIQAALA